VIPGGRAVFCKNRTNSDVGGYCFDTDFIRLKFKKLQGRGARIFLERLGDARAVTHFDLPFDEI